MATSLFDVQCWMFASVCCFRSSIYATPSVIFVFGELLLKKPVLGGKLLPTASPFSAGRWVGLLNLIDKICLSKYIQGRGRGANPCGLS